jgi:outer membrane protein
MKHVLASCLLSVIIAFGLSAQTERPAPKFGNIDMAQLFRLMPESKAVENELEQIKIAYDNEIQKMGEEYQIKVSDFVAVQQTLDPNIAEARAQEIEQLQQRIQQFREKAAQSLREQREAKTAPIIERVSQAIQAVGDKYGYTYIFDLKQAGIMYYSPEQCDDVFPLVKAELGF